MQVTQPKNYFINSRKVSFMFLFDQADRQRWVEYFVILYPPYGSFDMNTDVKELTRELYDNWGFPFVNGEIANDAPTMARLSAISSPLSANTKSP